ncbi:MAG TPA: AI-2E family transporter [Gammaproteobacteria bacterium]|nr:AI-2E family transporter [Gammaproteobacteria bacterium]
MSGSRAWLVLAVAFAGWLLYLLSPVLTPFLVAALLAYVGDPLTDRLEALGLSRTLAVVAVFVVMLGLLAALVVVLVPLLERQVAALIERLPAYLAWLQQTVLPRLSAALGLPPTGALDVGALKSSLGSHWKEAGGLLAGALATVSRSGAALLATLVNLLLIPVVGFYLLRDWDHLMGRLQALLPRRIEPEVVRLARESDDVLGAFLRGQLLVMLALGAVYTAGLWLVGLDLALLIGLLAGLVSFVPYLGFIVGIATAGVAAYGQFHALVPVLYVLAVFGVGQVLESMVLTPWLVGDRIGLHPVAVMFAVLAGGQLFGFFGVLLALPVASVIMVLVRDAHRRYLDSGLYESDA